MFGGWTDDIAFAIRQIRRAPIFSAVVVLTFAIGVGALGALLSVLSALVLRPLTAPDPERLVSLSLVDGKRGQPRLMHFATYLELAQRQQVFDSVCAYSGGGQFTTQPKEAFVAATIEAVTPEYFTIMGLRPFLGRFIGVDDMPPDAEPARVVVLGHRYWRVHLGADPHVVGQSLRVDGVPLSIIGILPRQFQGLQIDAGADIVVPLSLVRRLGASASDPSHPVRAWHAIGRLRDGIHIDEAREHIRLLWSSVRGTSVPATLSASERLDFPGQQIRVESAAAGFSGLRLRYARPAYLLVALAAVLLLAASSNLSGLLLARSVARRQQLATCLALGANRARLVRQIVSEVALLALAGAILAVPIAFVASAALGSLLWIGTVPLALQLSPDVLVVLAIGLVATTAGIVVSAGPAYVATNSHACMVLDRSSGVLGPSQRWGRALLVAQVALSVLLLFGAGLFARSLVNVRSIESGFQAEGLIWARLVSQPGGYRNLDAMTYIPELVRHVAGVPGIKSVGLSRFFPTYFAHTPPAETVGRPDRLGEQFEASAPMEVISPEFFETVGVPVLKGRTFSWHDHQNSPRVAIINESLEHLLFPSENPIGKQIRIGVEPRRASLEIVGIVKNVTVGNIHRPNEPTVFVPMLQEPQLSRVPVLNLRTSGDVTAVSAATQRAVASLGREYVRNLYSLEEHIDESMLQERLLATISVAFATVSILLACLGVYALLAYAVAKRTREIGVRVALGASPATVLRMVLNESLLVTLLGAGIGIPMALLLGRLIASLLFEVSPYDPVTLMAAAGSFVCVGCLAGLIPAYRASAVDSAEALRSE